MATKENSKNGVLVQGTSKADSIKNAGAGSNVTIDGGKGNDSIVNDGNSVSINAGAGNDYIYNWGSSVTIDGGKGNDTIKNDIFGGNVMFVYSGGNDSISGFYDTSTLKIASGTMNSVINVNANDLFLSVGNSTITLAGATRYAEKLNIVNSKGKAVKYKINTPNYGFSNGNDYVINRSSNVTLNALGGHDYIENDGSSVTIDGGAGNDYIDNDGVNVSINAGAGDDSIRTWGSNVTIAGGKGNDYIDNEGSSVTIDGGAGDDIIANNVYGSNASINAGDGNDSISNSRYSSNVTIDGGAGNDSIRNYGYNVSINAGTGDDYIYNDDSDVTIDGGAGNDTIDSYWGTDVLFVYSGGNDSIRGFDSTSTLKIATGTMNSVINTNGYDLFLSVGNSTITLEGAAFYADKLNIVNSKGKAVKYKINTPNFSFTSGNDSVINFFSNVTLNALGGHDSIRSRGDSVIIDGGTGNDYIFNYLGESVKIDGGKGNDSIDNNGGSNVTIDGGVGNDLISLNADSKNDLIEYSSGDGNDTIYGFKADSTLSIAGGSYSTTKSGNNIIVSIGKGKVTLNGASSLSAVHINNDIILTDKTKTPVTVESAIKTIDASTRTKAIKITGNSKANIIFGGKGNDSLWGGKGNDSLYGGDGKDVFIYKPGEGTDTIFDYASGDMLKILKSDGKEGGTFTSSSFKSNTLTLAIDGGGKVVFDNVSSSDKFNINGTTYKISGTKLK